MPRLTKDERIGAIALALVALGICGTSLIIRQCSRGAPVREEVIREMVMKTDSLRRKEIVDSLEKEAKLRRRQEKKQRSDSLRRQTDKSSYQGEAKKYKNNNKKEDKRKGKREEKSRGRITPARDMRGEEIPVKLTVTKEKE